MTEYSNLQTNAEAKTMSETLVRTYKKFGIDVVVEEVIQGCRLYEFRCTVKGGVATEKVTGLLVNLEYALAVHPISIVPMDQSQENKHFNIVVPISHAESTLLWSDMVQSEQFKGEKNKLCIPIGETISGEPFMLDFSEAKHILMGGSTGSGKSNLFHVIINSLLLKNNPNELELVLMDPKRVELTLYRGISYLYGDVVIDSSECVSVLENLLEKLNHRLTLDTESISKEPRVLIAIDELSDFMCSNPQEVEQALVRIAKQGHTVGMHLILSTSRPATDIYTESIRETIPTRIAGATASSRDSEVVLGIRGAEKLLGTGDMLMRNMDKHHQTMRFQAYCIPEGEISANIEPLKSTHKTIEAYDVNTKKILQIPIDKINIGETDMETYNKSESYIHVFKCRNQECRLEFMVLSWLENWQEKFTPYCPECGKQDSIHLRQRFINRKIWEIVSDPKLGQDVAPITEEFIMPEEDPAITEADYQAVKQIAIRNSGVITNDEIFSVTVRGYWKLSKMRERLIAEGVIEAEDRE